MNYLCLMVITFFTGRKHFKTNIYAKNLTGIVFKGLFRQRVIADLTDKIILAKIDKLFLISGK